METNLQVKKKVKKKVSYSKKQDKYLWAMIIIPLIYYVIFRYLPMYGIIISFEKYSPYRGIMAGPWVGFRWFIEFFNSNFFWRLIKNTLLLNLYNLVFGFPAPIILALLINEIRIKSFKKAVQTISYLPHFVSTVVVVGLICNFTTPNIGFFNQIRLGLGLKSLNFLVMPEWFRTIFVGSGIWQELGWSSIIYLAALSGVDPQLYEAATVDGANRFKQIIHITIPSILPTIIILLILSMGHMLSVGAEKVLLLYNPSTYPVADVINTYVYRVGIGNNDFSYGSAVGLFQSVINFILIVTVNKLSRKLSEISLW